MSISKNADWVLTTARLVLRSARTSDAADLHGVFGDPETMRYWSTVPDPDLAATQARVARMIAETGEPPVYFVVEMHGRAIGTLGAYNGNEVGFILNRAYHRQGLVREAMGVVIPYLFSVLEHDSLTADADPENLASVGLLKSLGFAETHRAQNTFCIDGRWSHSVYLALRRPN